MWNFVTLSNENVHVFTIDIEWDFCPGTEIGVFFEIVLFNTVFFNVVFFFHRVTKTGAIELFGLSIVTIFNDWIIA